MREGERLQTGTVGGQLGDGVVGDEDTLLQIHPLQLVARPGQSLQSQL